MPSTRTSRAPKYRTIPIPRILGLNEDENPAELAPGELVISKNVYRRGRTKGTRPGFLRDPDTYTASMTGPVQGMFQLIRSNGATKTLTIIENGVVKAATAGNLNGALTFNTSAIWVFTEFADQLYGAGGTLDDDFWSWDGAAAAITARAILNLSAAAIYPSFVFQKWNRLFTARFRTAAGAIATDASSNPTTVRYTPIAQPTVWPTANTMGGSSTIGGLSSYGDVYITGFGDFTDGNGDWLLILTNKKIYAASQTGDPLGPFAISEKGTIANGCVHQRAFVSLGLDSGDAIYLSDRGIHSIRQSQQFGARSETFLSWKIRNTFETINKVAIANSHGSYDHERGLVIFWVPTGAETTPNVGLVLDVKDKSELTAMNAEWDIWQLGGTETRVSASCSAVDSAGDHYVYAGTSGGDIGRFDPDVSADLGSGYTVKFRTKHEDYGEPAFEKKPRNLFVTLQPGGDYTPTVQAVFDYGTRVSSAHQLNMPIGSDLLGSSFILGLSELASSTVTVQDKLYIEGSGQTIGFEFSHASAAQPFYIGAVSPEIAILGSETPGAGSGGE